MVRRLGLCLVVLGALTVTPAAFAGGPQPMAQQGGLGTLSNDGSVRFVALGAGTSTVLAKIGVKDGSVRKSQNLIGSLGTPVLYYGGAGEGLFHDGSMLVLQSTALGKTTDFQIVSTRDFATRDRISLNGTFTFDALSPDGKSLYLIQHRSVNDFQHYVVRSYDLTAHRLLPGRIADRTQTSWVMQGWAMTRTTSVDGRCVYTLYQNPGGYPFIHALDTSRGVAHCIGLPWTASDQSPMAKLVLSLHGKTLAVHWRSGKAWLNLNTTTWKTSPVRASSFPWLWLVVGLAAAGALAAAGGMARRRRAAGTLRVSPA